LKPWDSENDGKIKDLEDKSKEKDDKLSISHEQLKEEIKENKILSNNCEKLRTEWVNSDEMKKGNEISKGSS
jgi:hypothetical protein